MQIVFHDAMEIKISIDILDHCRIEFQMLAQLRLELSRINEFLSRKEGEGFILSSTSTSFALTQVGEAQDLTWFTLEPMRERKRET